jgi:DnaJ-class molecular chaperone
LQNFKEAADEHVGMRSGNVQIKVSTMPHKTFKRQGNDLLASIKITLRQALLGFETKLRQLDGRWLIISRKDKITKPGEV